MKAAAHTANAAPDASAQPAGAAPTRLQRLLTGAAPLAAMAVFAILGVRLLNNSDLGYHLSYGQHFLDTGEIVDSSPMVFTVDAVKPGQVQPGPGCWWDEAGIYHFPNANWLTQVIMAGVYRLGGVGGLAIMQSALVAALGLILLLMMRRLGLGPLASAGGLLLAALASYERLTLRPELLGYVVLGLQLLVLARPGPFNWRRGATLVALQLLLVNLHSYFLLGVAVTGAFAADALARWLWARYVAGDAKAQGRDATAPAAARLRLLGGTLLAQIAASLVNPWGWRLAVLPFQTLYFMSEHGISGGAVDDVNGHPWSGIGELLSPLGAESFWDTTATYAWLAVMVVSILGAAAAAVRKRWAWALVIVGLAMASASVRRNIAVVAIALPLTLAALADVLAPLARRLLAERRRPRVKMAAAALLIAASAALGVSVVTQHFYTSDNTDIRFGVGLSRLALPIDASRQLGEMGIGRVWCDMTPSSTVHFFSGGCEVPVLTNTWAAPPEVMRQVREANANRQPYRIIPLLDQYRVDAVLLHLNSLTAPAALQLIESPDWAMLRLDALHATWVRRSLLGADAAQISADTLDPAHHLARVESQDPWPAMAVDSAAATLQRLGWYDPLIEMLDKAVEKYPRHIRLRHKLGVALASRGLQRERERDYRGRKDWQRAIDQFERVLAAEPDHAPARQNHDTLRRQLDAIRRGHLIEP
jgi:hypothetical protein